MPRLFLTITTFFLTFSSFCWAENIFSNLNPYEISNIAINIEGESPSDAKDKAFIDARKEAFGVLLNNLDIQNVLIDNIEDTEISNLVKSQQVGNESISGNNYSALFKIIFAKKFVEQFLTEKNLNGQQLSEIESYLILPIMVEENRKYLWENNNFWRQAISKNLDLKEITKDSPYRIILPNSDIENRSSFHAEDIRLMNYDSFKPILHKYNSKGLYNVFFSSNAEEILVDVYYVRKLQTKHVKLSFVNSEGLSKAEILDMVASKTIDYLFSDEGNKMRKEISDLVRIKVSAYDLEEWLKIKQRISQSGLVSQIIIESVSRDEISILVNYLTPKVDIVSAFRATGINLKLESQNLYRID